MSNKKSDDDKKPTELQELEQRVDAMMSTELSPKKPAKASVAAKKTSSLRVVSDYDDSRQTAPELSPKLLKTSKTDEPVLPEPPAEIPAPAKPGPEAPPAEPEPNPEPATAKPPAKSLLEDTETDEAVDDIVVHEGDTQLAVDDAMAKRRSAAAELQNRRGFLTVVFTSYWTWLFIIGIAGVTYAWFH